MEKTVNRPRFLVILSAVMAAVMLAISPLQVFAVNEKAANTYISELIAVSESQLGDEKLKDYTVVETPIYNNTLDAGNGAGKTYLAYKTTDRPEEAITDIRVMNMNGGWSFAEYESYLQDLTDNAKRNAARLWDAVCEFRDYYENYADSMENVRYAYDLLNVFYDDDVTDKNGEPMRLGDLLLSDKISDAYDEVFIDLLLECNLSVLQVIETALATACSRDENGVSFLDTVSENYPDLIYEYGDDYFYDETADAILASMDSLREDVLFYESCARMYSGLDEEELEAKMCGTDSAVQWASGKLLKKTLTETEYSGIDGEYETLYDLFFPEDEDLLDEDHLLGQLRPIAAAMSKGLRSTMTLGIRQIVSICAAKEGQYYGLYNAMLEDPEDAGVMKNGISAFFDVDREIYEDHAVAMTSDALRGNAVGDMSWNEGQKQLDDTAKEHEIAGKFLIACSVVMGTVIPLMGLAILSDTSVTLLSFIKDFLGMMTFQLFTGSTATIGGLLAGALLSWTVVLSVAGFIVALVLLIRSRGEDTLYYDDYVEIPGMICDYRRVTDPETGEKTENYIYYKGVVDPCGVKSTALFAQKGKSAQLLPDNPKGVMDLCGWELRGARQWLALYTTKDRRAGYPIRCDETFCVTGENKSGLFAAFFGDDSSKACDLAQFYNHSIEKNPDADERFRSSPVYLGYTVDDQAVYTDSAEQRVTDRLVGSAVASGASWAMGAIGLALGCAGGFIVGKSSKKKTKTEK